MMSETTPSSIVHYAYGRIFGQAKDSGKKKFIYHVYNQAASQKTTISGFHTKKTLQGPKFFQRNFKKKYP